MGRRPGFLFKSKDFSKLSAVFTEDAFANYSIAAPIMNGLPVIESTLQAALANLTTQHSLTTQSIDVLSNRQAVGRAGTSAEGQMIVAYASYMDKLRVDHGTLKIFNRQVTFPVGPHLIENHIVLTPRSYCPFIRSTLPA